MILALDPGTMKCGLAVLDMSSHVLERRLVEYEMLDFEVYELAAKFAVSKVVVGRGTASHDAIKKISALNLAADIVFVPEDNSTIEARELYFRENPPAWFLKFIPKTLMYPPRPIDDYAAVVLGQRYLKS